MLRSLGRWRFALYSIVAASVVCLLGWALLNSLAAVVVPSDPVRRETIYVSSDPSGRVVIHRYLCSGDGFRGIGSVELSKGTSDADSVNEVYWKADVATDGVNEIVLGERDNQRVKTVVALNPDLRSEVKLRALGYVTVKVLNRDGKEDGTLDLDTTFIGRFEYVWQGGHGSESEFNQLSPGVFRCGPSSG